MKPTAEWTSVQKMEFFDLLIGLEERDFYSKWDYFFMVKDFMEKEMPEVWNQYLYETHGNVWLSTKGWKRYDVILNAQLSLTNLITYLLDNQEWWAWKPCGGILPCAMEPVRLELHCVGCEVAVKHPALLYAEGVK